MIEFFQRVGDGLIQRHALAFGPGGGEGCLTQFGVKVGNISLSMCLIERILCAPGVACQAFVVP
jgi:hypothetical protein